MDARTLALSQLDFARTFYDYALGGVDNALANEASPGTLSSIARIYMHPWVSLDVFMNTMALGNPMIWESGGWAAKTGGPEDTRDWTTPCTFDLAALTEYREAVIAATKQFFTTSPDDLLDKEIDSPLGKMTVMGLVGTVGLLHLGEHLGDIATLKGVRGMKGLPF